MTLPITATIITLNEEKNIVDCIRSLRGLCQEILVLDSDSSDATRELAEQEGAVVLVQKFLGDGNQKARAADLASHDWIFSIDADERLDSDLKALLPQLDLRDPEVAYAFRRNNYLGKHQITAGGFYPDYVTRLYNRTKNRYTETMRHDSVKAAYTVKTKAHLLHYTYANLSAWIDRINWLSSWDAWAMYEAGKKPSSPGGHALAAFIRKYCLKGGFLQGQDGLTVALTTTFVCYMKYLKLKEFHNNAAPHGTKDE